MRLGIRFGALLGRPLFLRNITAVRFLVVLYLPPSGQDRDSRRVRASDAMSVRQNCARRILGKIA